MIHVGFIGCGRIADLHALGYRDNPDARIYAVCGLDAEQVEARKAEWGAEKGYTDYRALLEDPQVNAVEVLTPYDTHEEIVIAAAAAGKHIACQKPMTTSLASANRMVAAAERAGVVFKVTEIYVTYPPIVLARKLIDEGAIGEPAGMHMKYIGSPIGGWYVPPSTYEQQLRIASRGFGLETFDHGHHEWATGWYLLGEVERVCAWVDSAHGMLDLPAVLMWKGREGKRYGVCDYMFAEDLPIPSKYYSNDEWFEVTGSRGIVQVNRGTGELLDRPPVSLFTADGWRHFEDVRADWAEGFIASTHNFIGAILGREAPRLSGTEACEVLRFALAIMMSARKRREVYLDEIEAPFPWFRTWRRRLRERKEVIVGPRPRRLFAGLGGGTEKYASKARELTESLDQRFDAQSAGDWNCVVGLALTGEGGVAGQDFGITVREGRLEVTSGALPEDADVTLRMPAGTWAAILLGKKRLEVALFQGKIKHEGRGEEALRMRKALGI